MLDLGPTLLQCDLTLTNYICNDSFQIRPPSGVLGARNSTNLFAGQNSTHNNLYFGFVLDGYIFF